MFGATVSVTWPGRAGEGGGVGGWPTGATTTDERGGRRVKATTSHALMSAHRGAVLVTLAPCNMSDTGSHSACVGGLEPVDTGALICNLQISACLRFTTFGCSQIGSSRIVLITGKI